MYWLQSKYQAAITNVASVCFLIHNNMDHPSLKDIYSANAGYQSDDLPYIKWRHLYKEGFFMDIFQELYFLVHKII